MGLKYERQVRLDRGGRQSNCLESGILFLVVHSKELHQMNWKAKKHTTDTGVFFVSIRKLSSIEWDWRYDEYDFANGCDECRSYTAHGMIVKYPKFMCMASTYYISIPNVWKSESEPEQITFGGKTIHDTVMRVVNWQKQQEKVTP